MKTTKAITHTCLFGLCAFIMSCTTRATIDGGWKLAWQENFNQKDGFDTSAWSKIGRGRSEWNKYMSDYEGCYDMQDGKLVLRGIKNPGVAGDTATYLTGGLFTRGKKLFSDGLIEIRAKLQNATGAWPAIWMLPENASWPHGGEIDIMERLNGDSIAYQTIHTNYTYNLGIKEDPLSHSIGAIDPEGYNVYTAELHRDSIAFYINGRHTFTYPRIETDKQGQFPFDRPYYLLIDMQLGGNWVGAIDPDDVPVEMVVDWVRFYQKAGKRKGAKQ